MPEDVRLLVALVAAGSAIIGAAVGSLSTIVVTWITKRSDERKHLREVIVNAAVENYKQERAILPFVAQREPDRPIRMYPLDDFVLSLSWLTDIIDQKLSPDEFRERLIEMDKRRQIARDFWNNRAEP